MTHSPEPMIVIRRATPDDIPWILEQLVEFAAFFSSRRSLFPERAHAEAVIATLIADHAFFVAERLGDEVPCPMGFIAGMLSPHFFNPSIRVLTELFWWVPVAHRGTRAGAMLLAALLAYGRANADWISMSLEAESPVHPSCLLKRGFRAKETSYLLEVER